MPTTPRARTVQDVFEDAYNYMKSGQLMRQVVNKINGIDFNNLTERQHFGDIYEQILNDLQSAGNAGEYYTPRAVTSFMVQMTDPNASFPSCIADRSDLFSAAVSSHEIHVVDPLHRLGAPRPRRTAMLPASAGFLRRRLPKRQLWQLRTRGLPQECAPSSG